MELTTSFSVAQPVETVWDALTDLTFVAECLPGASVTGVEADGTHTGVLSVRLGSINATFTGTARMEEVDDARRRVRVRAGGSSGMGDARLSLRGSAEAHDEGTTVTLTTDVELTGRLAQLGHGVGARVTERLIQRMAATLERRLAGEDAPPSGEQLSAVDVLRSAVTVDAQRLVRSLAVFLVAAAVGWSIGGRRRRSR